MKPGARTRPFASRMLSDFAGLKFPIFVIREPAMRRLASRRGAPVPSASCALMMTRELCWARDETANRETRVKQNSAGLRIIGTPMKKVYFLPGGHPNVSGVLIQSSQDSEEPGLRQRCGVGRTKASL